MFRAFRQAWQDRREQAALRRRPIPELLWRRTLKRFPFLAQALPQDDAELRRLTSLFLDRKEFTGAHGLSITDDMAVAIAAQACLPVLRIGLQAYHGFVGIVVHPGLAKVRRERLDDDGVVHVDDEVLSGETVDGGPVMLSWRDVRASGATASEGYNVVIHEFAHVLDMTDGLPNGRPRLPPTLSAGQWDAVMAQEYQSFCKRVDAGEYTALDPYGATGLDEFFAVASEAFFAAPQPMRMEHPALFALLQRYYRPDAGTKD